MRQIRRSLGMRIGVSLAVIMAMNSSASAQDAVPATGDGGMIVFIGASQGIHVARMNEKTGALSPPQLAAETKSPNFLALHPTNKYLYAVGDLPSAKPAKSGAVVAFSIDLATGKLTELNRQSSGGRGPCHVAVDDAGTHVLTANYGSGSVACLPIADDGSLREPSAVIQHEGSGPDPKRQNQPHAHSFNFDKANRFALAADLGTDKILVYLFDGEKGTLTPNDPPAGTVAPGAGPRHLAWHPSRPIAYVINEMGNTITAFNYDPDRGALVEFDAVPTLPKDFQGGNTTAEVVVHPSGRFVYGSNRGHDSIAVFAADADGRLTPRGHVSTQGETPRNFAIDPSGRFLLAANQETDSVVVFAIDPETGELTPTGSKIEVDAPVCIRFLTLAK